MEPIKVKQLTCQVCGYEWYPRITRDGHLTSPKTCAKCKSKYWDKQPKK